MNMVYTQSISITRIWQICLLGLMVCRLAGQEANYKQYREAGDLFYKEYKDYHNASEFYKSAYKYQREDSLELAFIIAECAFYSWDLSEAKKYYLKVLSYEPDTCSKRYRMSNLHLAQAYQRMQAYDDAIHYFHEVLDDVRCDPSNTVIENFANNAIKACEWAQIQNDKDSIIIIPIESINHPNTHELAPVIKTGSLIYTHFDFPEERAHPYEYQLGLVKTLNDTFLSRTHQDSTIAFLTFNSDSTRLYYSICGHENKLDMKCVIATSNLDGSDEQIILGGPSEDPTFIHPRIGKDYAGNEILFFVSNRIDGFGGLDIWYSNLTSDGLPLDIGNLKAVNTAADELSPFFVDSTLFFSSDHIWNNSLSFGGTDIFKIKLDQFPETTEHVEILSKPYNSSKNDFFYVKKDASSWLSSNRTDPLNLNANEPACCYDIFKVTDTRPPPPKKPEYVFFQPKIEYFCVNEFKGSGTTGVVLYPVGLPMSKVVKSDVQGRFEIEKGRSYDMHFLNPNVDDTIRIDVNQDGTVSKDYFKVELDALYNPEILDYCSLEPIELNELSDIYMVPLIRNEQKRDGSDFLKLNKDGNFQVERGMDYWLVVQKEGYATDTLTVRVDERECEVFSCEFSIKKKLIDLNVAVACNCNNVTCYMSTENYSIELNSDSGGINNYNAGRDTAMTTYSYKVTPFHFYSAELRTDAGETFQKKIQISMDRGDCKNEIIFQSNSSPR